MAEIYAAECEATTITVNLVDPGATRTRMRAKAMPGEDPETLPAPEDVAPLFVELAEANCTDNGRRISFREWQESLKHSSA